MVRCASTLKLVPILSLAIASAVVAAPLTLASKGKTDVVIVLAPDATVVERHAASELAAFLKQITGAEFPVQDFVTMPAGPALFVGPNALLATLAPDLKLDNLKTDGLVIESRGPHLILAGDRPRGTLYAVYTFLEDVLGCRWWSSKVSTIPSKPELVIPEQHLRFVPRLEYREPFWSDAFDADWAARNKSNGSATRLDETRGGKVSYGGLFVHTFFSLVPPAQNFAAHPEWYSEIDGKRLGGGGEYVQLCVTNEELKKFMAQQVLGYLKAHPEANIISVSQNDADSHCLCANCKKLEAEEGSPAGPLLHFVNYVAAAVATQYPNVAIDTLAYQYTRKPPLHARPLPNVIVRLCSIECDFSQPLTAPSNQTFADDIRGWSKICQRLYIWDYTTNFAHYILPHPNLRVLGPNVRFFVENGVKGIFEQGAYTSLGAEFAELKAWVLAKVLWDPELDNDKLVAEFVTGYYGAAAPYISQYITLIHDEAIAKKTNLTCFASVSADFLNLDLLGQSEALFVKAEAAAKDDPALLQRVQVARLPLRYVWARRWAELKDKASRAKLPWPGPADEIDNAKTFSSVAQAYGITMISEGARLDSFERRTTGMGRIASPPPAGCEKLPAEDVFDFQDTSFGLYQEGTISSLEHDDLASDKVAARMIGSTQEWATQQPLTGKPWDADATYTVYIAVRVEKTGNEGGAFTAGIYDTKNRIFMDNINIPCADIADDQYHVYKIGTAKLHGDVYLWAAPPKNPDNVKYVWVDRFWAVRER